MSLRPETAVDPRRLGYIVWRFPKLSETFVMREIEALERLGWRIDVFAHTRPAEAVRQPEAVRWLERMDAPDSFRAVAAANLAWLREAPRPLLSLYVLLIGQLWREPRELVRGVVALLRAAVWARRVRERGIMHVHAHFARHSAVAALAVAHLAGVTYSFTGHSHDVYRHPAMLATKVRRARFVAVVSALLRDRYIAPQVGAGDLARVHVVRCGVEVDAYSPTLCDTARRPLNMLAVARLIEVKGLRYLIEACRILVERGYDLHCRIIGEGPLQADLQRRIAEAGLGERVELLGPRPHDEVRRALADASIFILPSIVMADGTMEGVPVSLMEAMALGVPVVATRTGAIPELVGDHTGLLVEPADAEALAGAIACLADDAALARRLSVGARRYLADEFDLDANVARLDRLLLDATGAAGVATGNVSFCADIAEKIS